jgi:cyclohexyl-isocyanide hydratase
MTPTRIGLLLFPRLTQLDLTGPFEVFSKWPDATVHLVWKSQEPVAAETGMRILPDTTLADCKQLDVLCVPGGPGVSAMMEDAEVLAFLREQARGVRFLTSVCTGALILGAAGLLRGKRATTHWASHELLGAFGAIPTKGRVVRDGNLITGGGVTAGIDFALTVVADIAGPAVAQGIQLQIEYAPAPPFAAGSPDTAPPEVLSATRQRNAATRAAREELVARIARTLAV